jgi:antitoxin HicB
MSSFLNYRVVIEPLTREDGGGFLASAPELPGCISDGETPHEALSNIHDAMTQWIDEAKALGRTIPEATMAAA